MVDPDSMTQSSRKKSGSFGNRTWRLNDWDYILFRTQARALNASIAPKDKVIEIIASAVTWTHVTQIHLSQ